MDRKPTYIPDLKANWLTIFMAVYGVFVFLPILAPFLMKWKVPELAKPIYDIYSLVCHQLPQRSLFFFGPKFMYSLTEIQSVWQKTEDPSILRQFIGNPELGWKVAWSDRMISMYGGIWLASFLWASLRKHFQRISIWFCALLGLPLVLDGTTHFISDLYGISEGFRYTNHWLAVLTTNSLPASFYAGDAIGSFNSWARWLSGLLFGFGLVWWIFPYIKDGREQSMPVQFESAKLH
jgi:uncharacterized membrane protein